MRCRQFRPLFQVVAAGLTIVCLSALPTPARADKEDVGMKILNFLGIGVGGYWTTSDSAEDALGSPKFLGHTTFWVKPAHKGSFTITGGYQEVSVRDHWQPFSGGNRFNLQGAALKITKEKKERYDLVPFLTAGVYYGELHSIKQNYRANKVVPSVSLGLEKEVARYVRISGGYRVTSSFGGVNTSGGYLSLTLFP
jgi:hypothetical protein